jgi:hypothetical protein
MGVVGAAGGRADGAQADGAAHADTHQIRALDGPSAGASVVTRNDSKMLCATACFAARGAFHLSTP